MRRLLRSYVSLLILALFAMACKGEIGLSSDAPLGDESSTVGGDPTPSSDPIDPFPDFECEGLACQPLEPRATPGVTRLTHLQWENSVRDLLVLEQRPGVSSEFLNDQLNVGNFDRLASALEVQPGLWEGYREAAETLAADAAQDPERLDAIAPDVTGDGAERAESFVRSFVTRAYRRPLTDEEVSRHVTIMMASDESFAGEPTFADRAELLIRAVLQSPHFLYRVDTTTPGQGEVVELDPYERASRLSYAVWNSAPDDALLNAAEAGELDSPEGFRSHVLRMLEDPKASEMILDFHGQLFRFDHFDEMSKDSERFPEFTDTTPESMRTELELFLVDTLHTRDGTFRDLMRSRTTFVDDSLAALYGVSSPGEEFARVELDQSERRGLLTRLGFLATNATAYDPNPIHRGVFVNEHILCNEIPLPPDDFSIPEGVEGNTNRERIEAATGECGSVCHTPLINPAGYAFESYDALGKWRTEDGGFPVDTTGALRFDGELNSFEGPLDFIDAIAESPQAHTCYVKHWFEYLHGALPQREEPLVARVAQVSHQTDAPLKAIIAGLLVNDVFLKRATPGESQ